MKHYNIRITGRVQGVWYRDSARSKARELGITGFVRNDPDGSVYIEAEGGEGELKKLVEWCWEGPPRAKVESVDVEEGEVKDFTEFEISRSFF
ncbi:MAG TPA: acylphosphatase [Chitinophagales bacterium]|nr:acylphosphatase [Chitinophagales bacterium]